MNEETRQELARLRVLASKLTRHFFNTDDPQGQELAGKIMEIAATLCQQAEQESPLPAVSMQSAGLEVPLHLLDTPANRRFLDALRDAAQTGLEVDRERGYGEDGPNQVLWEMVNETRQEVFGARGTHGME